MPTQRRAVFAAAGWPRFWDARVADAVGFADASPSGMWLRTVAHAAAAWRWVTAHAAGRPRRLNEVHAAEYEPRCKATPRSVDAGA